jgi:hemerythrin superfamily protein
MSDAVQLLEEQHAEASALLAKLERVSDPATYAQIFRTLDAKLRDHAAIEEKIFYPAFRERASGKLPDDENGEALKEQREIKSALAAVEQTSVTDYTFKAKVADLKNAVQHHVKEEEQTILPQALRLFSESELDDLGLRMRQLASINSPVYEMGTHR